MTTFTPFARLTRIPVEPVEELTEEHHAQFPDDAAKYLCQVAQQVAGERIPAAICGHRPVLPSMLEALGITYHPMKPAEIVVVFLNEKAETIAYERHRPTF